MADVAVLGLRVDASGAIVATEQLAASLNRLGTTGTKAEKSVGSMAGGFLKFVGATVLLRKFVDETSSAQFAQAQLEAAIVSTGNAAGQSVAGMQAYAKSLQDITMFSDEAVQGAQAVLLAFTNIRGDTFNAATLAAANLAERMGGDLADAARTVGKALQDQETGLNMLNRQYRLFSQAEVDALKKMQDLGKQSEAQAAILARLEQRFGGAAGAARNTFGGALAYARNQFSELFEIGTAEGSGLVSVLNAIGDSLKAIKDNMAATQATVGGILLMAGAWKAVALAARLAVAAQAQFALSVATGTVVGTLTGLSKVMAIVRINALAMWTAVGGPWAVAAGVVIAGISALWYKNKKAQDEARAAHDQWRASASGKGPDELKSDLKAIETQYLANARALVDLKRKQEELIAAQVRAGFASVESGRALKIASNDVRAMSAAQQELIDRMVETGKLLSVVVTPPASTQDIDTGKIDEARKKVKEMREETMAALDAMRSPSAYAEIARNTEKQIADYKEAAKAAGTARVEVTKTVAAMTLLGQQKIEDAQFAAAKEAKDKLMALEVATQRAAREQRELARVLWVGVTAQDAMTDALRDGPAAVAKLAEQQAFLAAATDAVSKGMDFQSAVFYALSKVRADAASANVATVQGFNEETAAMWQQVAALNAGVVATEAKIRADLDAAVAAKKLTKVEAEAILVERQRAQAALATAEAGAEQAKMFKENLVRGLQESAVGFFEGLVDEGFRSFDSLVKRIKALFVKLFAELAAAKLMNKLATTSLGGFLGLVPRPGAGHSIGGTAIDLGQYGKLNLPKFTPDLTGGQRAAGIAGAAIGGGLIGYGVGTATQSKSLGALSGAASGAAMGAAFGPLGAAVGGVVGMIGGLIGGHKAQKKAMKEAQEAIASFNTQMAGIRLAINNDALGASIEQAKKQFLDLRKSINDSLKGRKNEAERNRLLAEANALEAQSIAKLQQEFALKQQFAQQDAEVRRLTATGRSEEAAALAAQIARAKELADLRRDGATAETIAAVTAAQLAEEEKRLTDARKAAAQVAEEERRRMADLAIGTLGFTDPRGANDADFAEEQQRRLWDAVQRGASEAELAAIRLYNAAQAAAREAEIVETTTRAREALTARGLAASGDTRGAEDATRTAAARQELADAIAQGLDPVTLAMLRAVQAAEASQARMQRAIEDGTAAIEKQTEEQVAVLETQIAAIRASADKQVAAINAQIAAVQADAKASAKSFDEQIGAIRTMAKAQTDAIDAQLSIARDALDMASQQVSALQESVATSQQVVTALRDFSDSLVLGDLSTLSPQDKLAEARRQFEALAAAATAGDAGAAGQLPNAANALLQASRAFNASNLGFVEDFNRVQSVIAAVGEKFGKQLSTDQQQLAAAQAAVAQLTNTVTLLQSQRDAITTAADQQLDALNSAKDRAAEDAQATIDRLTEARDVIKDAASAQITRLEETRDAIREESTKQIAALIKLETEAHDARLEADANWKAFMDIVKTGAGTATADAPVVAASAAVAAELRLVQDAIRVAAAEQIAATQQVVTPVVAMATALRDGPPPATAFQQDLTLGEQQRTNEILREKLDALGVKLDVLTNTTVAASNAEVAATTNVAVGISVLAGETRNAANAAVARRGS